MTNHANTQDPIDDRAEDTDSDLVDDSLFDRLEKARGEIAGLSDKVAGRVKKLEPRDWSNFVEPMGFDFTFREDPRESLKAVESELDFWRRCDRFLEQYTDLQDNWRFPLGEEQRWMCYYHQDARRATVLRTFAPVVHRGVECGGRTSDGACTDFEHLVVACLHHASALGNRTDDELRAAMQEGGILSKCYPIALLPSGHGWCGTGFEHPLWGKFHDSNYRPGGWDGIGDLNAEGVYAAETSLKRSR